MHKINKTAVAFLRRYATLFIKKTQYLLSRLRMNSLWRRTILNGLRLRSGHVQRKKYFKFCVCRALRSAPNAIFTGGVVEKNGIFSAAFCESMALRLAPSPSQSPSVTALPKGEPLAWRESFRQSRKLCRWERSPGGSCRAATEGVQIGGAGKNG